MRFLMCFPLLLTAACLVFSVVQAAGEPSPPDDAVASLRLVPFPKQVRRLPGGLRVEPGMALSVSGGPAARQAAEDLRRELAAVGGRECALTVRPGRGVWRLALLPPGRKTAPRAVGAPPDQREGYRLTVTPQGARVEAREETGLRHGIETLRQWVRANLRAGALPCVAITDYPSLRWRGFLDDITRGPSPKLATLQREAALAGYLRMNGMTYYLEHQFRFRKHPAIGPPNGSVTPEELKAFVGAAKQRGVEVVGCQQSFGHFGNILKHPQYAPLRETPDILDPTNEASYRLLDDLYAEQMPALQSPWFLVCCDETWGLGTGPSKALAEQIGVGGVYVRHINRLHDLVTGKYGKRMLMWGDIILQHPDRLKDIPKDTLMLSWGYHAADSFDDAILPFARSGFEFLVCPGVNNWSRILPDFATATVNIRNYVRDGAKHGARGMLNTTWHDDGETLFAANWHGLAWGAECAWNASATSPEDFNRRIGGVLFGEKGGRFGQAIVLLGRAHSLPGYGAMMDGRFWQGDMGQLPVNREETMKQARALLALVDPAIQHLRAVKREATANAELLDHFLFGAERMRLMATRAVDYLRAADLYEQAYADGAPAAPEAAARVERAARLLSAARDSHRRLKREHARLWQGEMKPYALDRVMARYDAQAAQYDRLLAKLKAAQMAAQAGHSLPAPETVGLAVTARGARSSRPRAVLSEPLASDASWAAADCGRRLGLTREDDEARPLEVDLPVSEGRPGRARLFALDRATGAQRPVTCQVEAAPGNRARLVFMAEAGAGDYLLYLDAAPDPLKPAGMTVTDAPGGMKVVENDRIRLLIGPEGAHIYRWEVKAAGGRDITQPGESEWAGFADITGPHRAAPNRIETLAAGPVRARLRCSDATGLVKTFDVWAGADWVECSLNAPTGYFACFDDIALMGAESAAPGTALFSNGDTAPVKPLTGGPDCQEARDGQTWCAKYVPGGLLMALLTPETPTRHVVGPGGGMGGVVAEGGAPAAHFVMVGGSCPPDPRAMLDGLRAALDFTRPLGVTLYSLQSKP